MKSGREPKTIRGWKICTNPSRLIRAAYNGGCPIRLLIKAALACAKAVTPPESKTEQATLALVARWVAGERIPRDDLRRAMRQASEAEAWAAEMVAEAACWDALLTPLSQAEAKSRLMEDVRDFAAGSAEAAARVMVTIEPGACVKLANTVREIIPCPFKE